MADGPGPAPDDRVRQMQRLAQQVWLRCPETVNSGATVGELAWGWGSGRGQRAAGWTQQVWLENGDPVAWGWIFAPERIRVSAGEWTLSDTSLAWQIAPGRPALLAEVLRWFDAHAGGAPQATTARAGDAPSLDELGQAGYARDHDAPWFQLNTRALDGLAEPGLPPGFRFLTAAQADPALVVAVHRAAWHPSSFTADSLTDVRSTWPYRDDLAVFVQAPDGRLVASALVWYDDVTRTAELEPVGTDPGFRRQGLGRAVSLFGLRQARDAGAAEAIVSCRGDERYPVPRRLYCSAGFTELSRDLVFRKTSPR